MRKTTHDEAGVSRLDEKYRNLVLRLGSMGRALVAFSGGVDSTFLLAAAKDALGAEVLAVTGRSPSVAPAELEGAVRLAGRLGVRHRVVDTYELDDLRYRRNSGDRCYHCKHELFSRLAKIARAEGIDSVVEGSNADDRHDHRPGALAAKELGVTSPLEEVGLSKQEIRALSKTLDLPTWNKPALACLASRIPYGREITAPRLLRVDRAEQLVRQEGVSQVRVRDHDDIARIEVPAEEIELLVEPTRRANIAKGLGGLGYRYVTVDLQGYRTGSLNEALSDTVPKSGKEAS